MKPKLTRYTVTFTISNHTAGTIWGADKNGTYVRHIQAANTEEAHRKMWNKLLQPNLGTTISGLSMKKRPRTK